MLARETSRRRVKVLEALVSDESGSIIATWYNQAYLEAAFRSRPEVLLRGVMMRKRGGSTFLVKRHEIWERVSRAVTSWDWCRCIRAPAT